MLQLCACSIQTVELKALGRICWVVSAGEWISCTAFMFMYIHDWGEGFRLVALLRGSKLEAPISQGVGVILARLADGAFAARSHPVWPALLCAVRSALYYGCNMRSWLPCATQPLVS